jgi:hypothetical protein
LRALNVNVYPQAIGALLGQHRELGRWRVVAAHDAIEPPLVVERGGPSQPTPRRSPLSSTAGSERSSR